MCFSQYQASSARSGEQEMGTAISCTKCSQVTGNVGRSSSKALSLRAAVFRLKIVHSDTCGTYMQQGGLNNAI